MKLVRTPEVGNLKMYHSRRRSLYSPIYQLNVWDKGIDAIDVRSCHNADRDLGETTRMHMRSHNPHCCPSYRLSEALCSLPKQARSETSQHLNSREFCRHHTSQNFYSSFCLKFLSVNDFLILLCPSVAPPMRIVLIIPCVIYIVCSGVGFFPLFSLIIDLLTYLIIIDYILQLACYRTSNITLSSH
jgi:hypothetical protein